jgi:hypothetical protein
MRFRVDIAKFMMKQAAAAAAGEGALKESCSCVNVHGALMFSESTSMKRTNCPTTKYLKTAPLLLVVRDGEHHCSVGCYTCVDTLCKWLQLHLELPPAPSCTFWAYQWTEGQWQESHVEIRHGLGGMLQSLGRNDGLWECPDRRKMFVTVKEFHSIHPHAIHYSIININECVRPKDNASYNRIHQWEGSFLVECISTKTLKLNNTVVSYVFPTAAISPPWRGD